MTPLQRTVWKIERRRRLRKSHQHSVKLVTGVVMTRRWSRRLTTVLLCLDVIVQLTLCNNRSGRSSGQSEQPVNYRGSVRQCTHYVASQNKELNALSLSAYLKRRLQLRFDCRLVVVRLAFDCLSYVTRSKRSQWCNRLRLLPLTYLFI